MIARELLVKLGFNIDEKKLNKFTGNVNNLKSQINELRLKISQTLTPNVNSNQLIAYRKELAELSDFERKKVLELNRIEKIRATHDTKRNRQKLRELQQIKVRLQETQNAFKRAARSAQAANQIFARHFSRYFRRFIFLTSGGFLLNLRSTLKNAENFKQGKNSADSGGFSKEQIVNIDRFNNSLSQTKRIISSIRNSFITGLLPTLKEYLDKLNYWLIANRELVQIKLKAFIDGITSTFIKLGRVFNSVLSFLNPLISAIGGWSNILSGIICIGILSWLVRLGAFLGRAANAMFFAVTAVKAMSIALLTNPMVLAITAIVGALSLLINEIYVTEKGGDSLINRFSILRKGFNTTKIVFEGFVDSLKEVAKWFGIINDKLSSFSFDAFTSIKNFFKGSDRLQIVPELLSPTGLEKIGETEDGLKIFRTIPELLKPIGLDKIDETRAGLKIFRVNERRHKFISPNRVANNTNHSTQNRNVINNKNNFNLSVNLPVGSSNTQAQEVVKLIQDKIQEQGQRDNLETLNAIGAY